MSKITGKFVSYKSENIKEYLISIAGDKGNSYEDKPQTCIFNVEGNKVKVSVDDKSTEFVLNTEVDEDIGGFVVKSTATIDGNTLTISAKTPSGTHVRKYEFSDNEMTLQLSSSKPGTPIAKRYYKKS